MCCKESLDEVIQAHQTTQGAAFWSIQLPFTLVLIIWAIYLGFKESRGSSADCFFPSPTIFFHFKLWHTKL